MNTYSIRTDYDKTQAIKRIESIACPMTITVQKGAPRSIEQNRLQRMWCGELEEQGDQTREEYRGYCKLHLGVAIAKEHDAWAEAYNKIMKPLDYQTKLKMMMEPLDFPVTRIMKSEQKTRYLNAIYTHFTGQGFRLTDPTWQGRAA